MMPIFCSHYSIGRSILTGDEPEEIVDNSPVSIFSIAKKHNLKEVFIADTNMSGFIQYYKSAEKAKVEFRFGLKLVVCNDLTKKDEESFSSESKVTIWCLNSEGYKDLIKIYSKAATDGFYYIARTDWITLNKQLTENLEITIPFYDSFIHNNKLKNNNCIPSFTKPPKFHIEDHNLPFDNLLKDFVIEYCKSNNYEMVNSHQVYYYKKEDGISYQTFRCINNRSTLGSPKMDHFSSDEFSFESYLERVKA